MPRSPLPPFFPPRLPSRLPPFFAEMGPDFEPSFEDSAEPRPSATEVVLEESAFIRKIARDVGTPASDADDIVQLVSQDLLLHPERIPPRSWLRNWLYVVTSRKARDFLDKRATRRRHETPLEAGEIDPDWHVPSGEDLLSSEQTRVLMQEVIATLSPRRREVLLRYEIYGDSMEEIAASLGVRTTTAYNLLRLARDQLKARCLRRWAADKNKPGGRSFTFAPLLISFKRAAQALRNGLKRLSVPTLASAATPLLLLGMAFSPAESLPPSGVQRASDDSMAALAATPPITDPPVPVSSSSAADPDLTPPLQTGLPDLAPAVASVTAPAPGSRADSASSATDSADSADPRRRSRERAAAWALISQAQHAAEIGDSDNARSQLRAYDRKAPDNPFAEMRSSIATSLLKTVPVRTGPR